MKKGIIALGIVVILLLLILLIGGPFYAKYYINKNAKELIGRRVVLDGLVFNSLNGHLTLRDFQLFETDDSTVFVSFDTLYIDLEIYKLFSSEIYADEIKLSHPTINIILDSNAFNFDDLIPKSDTSKVTTEQENETKYTFNNIKISHGFIDYQHIDMNAEHTITNLNLEIPGISWGKDKADAGLIFSLDKGGTFQTDFHFDKSTNQFNWNLNVLDLQLANTLPYIQNFAKIKSIAGDIDGSFSVFGHLDTLYAADFVTKINVSNLKLVDESDSDFLGFERLRIATDTLNMGKLNFQLDSVILDKPYVLYELDQDSISNLEKIILSGPVDSSETKEDTTLAHYSYYLNYIRIHAGSVNYIDHTLKPEAFKYSLSEIEFAADGIEKGNIVSYYLSTTLNSNGLFKGDMHFDPSDPGNGEFNLDIRDSEISDFSPFGLSYFAFPIQNGRLNFSTQNTVKDRYLTSHIVLDLFGAELGEKRSDFEPAYNVPLKLALIVLRDPKGRINFDVPAEGDMNSPDFKYRKLVFKVLLNVMVKAAISPYKLLSQAVGADEESIKKIKLDDGQNYVGPAQSSQIDLIARLLDDKPGLNASITLHVDADYEKEFLRERMAKKHFYAFNELGNDTAFSSFDNTDIAKIDAIETDDEGLLAYLQEKTTLMELHSFDSLASNLITTPEIDKIYDELLEQRIVMIQHYLTQKHDSIPMLIHTEWIDEKKVAKPYYLVEYNAD